MRGKKIDEAAVYQIMAAWTENPDNINEVCKKTGKSWNTCKKVIDENKYKPEFMKLCERKKDEFIKKAEQALDIAEDRLIEMLRTRNDIPVNHLSTVIGTLYDKIALARGEATDNTVVRVELPEEMKKYAR